LGYGATAINPYLAFETIHDEIKQGNWAIADGRKAAKSVEEYLRN
jgi:hypothetical protein